MTTTTNQSNYFNLVARGVGYVGRIRKVDGGKGRNAFTYNAISVNAMHGDGTAPEYTRFELEPKSAQAKAVVDYLMSQNIKDKKVLITFEAGDLMPYHFEYNGAPLITHYFASISPKIHFSLKKYVWSLAFCPFATCFGRFWTQ